MNKRTNRTTIFLSGLAVSIAAPSATLAQPYDPASNPPQVGQPGVDSDGDGVDDDVDAQPCDARVSARVFAPADRTWGMLLFEDQWPEQGDFDFNDLVLSYNQTLSYDSSARLTGLRVDLRVMAVGARYQNGLAIRLPGVSKSQVTQISLSIDGQGQNAVMRAADSEPVVTLTDDLHSLFAGVAAGGWVNTDPNLASHPYAEIVLQMQFTPGQGISAADAPFDIFLFNATRGTEVHRPRYRGTAALNAGLLNTGDDASTPARAFVTTNGIPFALELPETALYPTEGVSIDQLFPSIVQFGLSNGTQAADFFRNPSSGHAFGNVSPGALAAAASADVSCFSPDPGVCGSAAGNGFVAAPTSNLCGFGMASSVSSSGGLHRWTCTGNYSAPLDCDALDWVCQPNIAADCSASIPNGTGTQTCNGSGTGFNTCQLAACNNGYYVSGNTCLAQVCTPNAARSCAIANGTGSQTCNNLGSQWGGCGVVSCASGYSQVGNTCQDLSPNGANVYYQCANVEGTYGTNTGYVVFVENFDNLRTNNPTELLTACLHYGFRGLASSDSRTHRNNGWGVVNSSQIHQAVYCHNCYPSSGNEWYYNRSSFNSCTHASGVAQGTRNLRMATYVYNSDDTTFACMTFDQDLDGSTAFGNGATNDATHPWYTESSGQDPCNRTRVQFGDHYDGTPEYLLCASPTIQN